MGYLFPLPVGQIPRTAPRGEFVLVAGSMREGGLGGIGRARTANTATPLPITTAHRGQSARI